MKLPQGLLQGLLEVATSRPKPNVCEGQTLLEVATSSLMHLGKIATAETFEMAENLGNENWRVERIGELRELEG